MRKHSSLKLAFAGAAAITFAASAASAQSYDNAESVTVTAPHFRSPDVTRLNGPLERVSLSTAVRYDDLNVATVRGARTLRWRVRRAAWNVCNQLAYNYPLHQMSGTSCYRDAIRNGLIRADEAIYDARLDHGVYYYN